MKDLVDSTPSRQYEVDKIVRETGSFKCGTKRYLVRWKGDFDDTWEPEALLQAPDLITEFHAAPETP